MSPFKGQGANQALLDAVLLAQYLSWSEVGPPDLVRGGDHGGSDRSRSSCPHGGEEQPQQQRARVEAALAQYERDMLDRVRAKVLASREAVEILHSPLAAAPGTTCSTAIDELRRARVGAWCAPYQLNQQVLAVTGAGEAPAAAFNAKVERSRTRAKLKQCGFREN
jgi:hypothetical protein|eukprot:SAG25_NODE_1437_length_3023_cov_2.829343_3_plen_166_part_00